MNTAEHIINTATLLLQKNGFNAFSYHDISRQIGIKTSSIHYHFPGKHDLGKSIMKNYRALHNSELKRIDSESSNPVKKLQAFGELFICTLGDEFRMCPCGMLTTDINTLPEPIKEEVQGFFTDSEAWLASVLKTGIEQGLFSIESNHNEFAKTLFASFEGAMLSARAFKDKARLSKTIKQLIKLIQT